jgi:Ca2+-binding RTX toxin-like protein
MMLLAALLVAPEAEAGPAESSCTMHPQHARLEITVYGYPNVLSRVGDDVQLNGSSCDGATVHNTDRIEVTALLGSQELVTLRIRMMDGLFEPGATLGSVIPIHLDFTQVPGASLYVDTGAGSQHIEIDGTGIDLDAGASAPQADIVLSDMTGCLPDCRYGTRVSTGRGADRITQVHPSPATYPSISSGSGDDVVLVTVASVLSEGGDDIVQTRQGSTVFGGFGDDLLIGGSSTDELFGDYGNDRIYGAGGNDAIEGFTGRDVIVGGKGRDAIDAGSNGDWIWGGRGLDRFSGGKGNDRCQPNHGDNLHGTDCEHRLSVPPPAL